MGWMTMHETRTAKQFFTDMYANEPNVEIVDIAIKNFRTAYIAVRNKVKGYVYCQTYLIHRAPKSYENFGYKPVSEFCGPNTIDCPKKILDKLTPIEEIAKIDDLGEKSFEWAKNWREECLKSIETAKKLSKGVVIKMDEPIEFTSGASFQYFKKDGRKWLAIVNYGTDNERTHRVRFTNFKHMKYTFV